MIFRVHFLDHGVQKSKDVQAETPDQARDIIKPKGSTEPIIILKAKVLRT